MVGGGRGCWEEVADDIRIALAGKSLFRLNRPVPKAIIYFIPTFTYIMLYTEGLSWARAEVQALVNRFLLSSTYRFR
jgi:hypothetical protein